MRSTSRSLSPLLFRLLLLLPRLLPALVVAGGMLSATIACDGPRRDRDRDDDDNDRLPSLRPCDVVEDCLAGELCLEQRCHAACGPEVPCAEPRGVCDEGRGVCVQCLGDEQCGALEVCVLPQGECGPVECRSAADCADGEACVDDVCVAGLVCTPNEVGCVDETTAFVCAGDGSARQEAACRDDQICLEGVCRTQVCTPDTVVCAGNARVACDATGTDTTVTSCDGACADGGFGCACIDGACAPRACEPGSARCVGNAAQRCDAQGAGFLPLEDCGADSCNGGRCLPDACTAGASFCSGSTLLVCQSDGFGYDQTTCAETCSGADGSAQCSDQVCEPLSQACADATTLRVCNATGTATVDVPCGAAEVCDTSACVVESCVPSCGTRECGPDPLCGTSCGSCAGTCTTTGQCELPAGPTVTVELSWTPTSQDMDLRLSRDPSLPAMCGADICSFVTCQAADPRPDWDGSGDVSAGDPLLDVADVSNTNPEIVVLALPAGPQQYRIGADNFGPAAQGGAPATTTATVRVRVDGSLVSTHTRAVPSGDLWDGVLLSWSGTAMTASDDAGIVADFQCADEGGTGPVGCVADSACPAGQGCVFDQLGLFGTCSAVECTADANCTGGKRCNGNHLCVSGPLVGYKGQCGSDGDDGLCRVGLHCDALTTLCEEACSPVVCTGPGVLECCPLSGAETCTTDGLFGLTGNCD